MIGRKEFRPAPVPISPPVHRASAYGRRGDCGRDFRGGGFFGDSRRSRTAASGSRAYSIVHMVRTGVFQHGYTPRGKYDIYYINNICDNCPFRQGTAVGSRAWIAIGRIMPPFPKSISWPRSVPGFPSSPTRPSPSNANPSTHLTHPVDISAWWSRLGSVEGYAFQPRHSYRHKHRHEISLDESWMHEQADGKDDNNRSPRSAQPGVVPE